MDFVPMVGFASVSLDGGAWLVTSAHPIGRVQIKMKTPVIYPMSVSVKTAMITHCATI